MTYWLDLYVYSYNEFEKEQVTTIDVVRNYQAHNNLKSMNKGDEVLFYHSQPDRAMIEVSKEYLKILAMEK